MGSGCARWGCRAGLPRLPSKPQASAPGGVRGCPPADGALWESRRGGEAARPSASRFCKPPGSGFAALRGAGERQCRREGVPALAAVPWRGLPAVAGAGRLGGTCSVSLGCTSYLEAARNGGGCGVEAFLPVPRTLRSRMQAPTLGDPGVICAGCQALKVPLPSITGSREKRGLLLPSTQRHRVSAGRPARAAGKGTLL